MIIPQNDKHILVAVVARELADVDDSTLRWGEFLAEILPDARRKLSYWLGSDVSDDDLFEAQDALVSGDDIAYESSVNRIIGI